MIYLAKKIIDLGKIISFQIPTEFEIGGPGVLRGRAGAWFFI